jgi:cytoskeletal protein RodZ
MVTKRKSGILVFVVTLATATLLATSAISATPTPTATQPQVEATAPTTSPETRTAPVSEQKASNEQSKNGKNDKKKGRVTGMMLALFAIITGHQGAAR